MYHSGGGREPHLLQMQAGTVLSPQRLHRHFPSLRRPKTALLGALIGVSLLWRLLYHSGWSAAVQRAEGSWDTQRRSVLDTGACELPCSLLGLRWAARRATPEGVAASAAPPPSPVFKPSSMGFLCAQEGP